MYLGIDLGTSGLRALLVDASGAALGHADAGYDVQRPHPGWSEQDPDLWIAAFQSALAELGASFDLRAIRAVSVAGHMHGAVVIGADDRPLCPCILWNDTRAAAEAQALDTDEARRISGNIVFPGFTAPKLAWLQAHRPEVFAACVRVVLPKDYLIHWLCGVWGTEMSDASGTAWLDVGARSWSEELLAASGMRADQMPALREGTAHVGAARAETGLPPCAVIAGAADNAAAACGAGVLGSGRGFVSLGTSGVVLVGQDGFVPDAGRAVHTFAHAVPGRWYKMGVTLACTDALNWLARLSGQSPAALTADLGDITPPDTLQVFPYLSGERTPYNDAEIRGGMVGLDISHSAVDLTRAVLEGTSMALAQSLTALGAPERLMAIGGGTASGYWVQLLTNLMNVPLDIPEDSAFGAALGAARLAMCGDGAAPEDVMTPPAIAREVTPDPNRAPWDAAQARFEAGYTKLKALT